MRNVNHSSQTQENIRGKHKSVDELPTDIDVQEFIYKADEPITHDIEELIGSIDDEIEKLSSHD